MRHELLQQLDDPQRLWDMIVIGGGATGLGTAVDAAARGYRTLLLERLDFASGTSSRSTKLIHGGLRYLRQGNLDLVRESLHERGLLMRNAPHLVHNLSFVVPLHDWWEGPFYGTGLKLYDLLAGRLGLGPSRHLSRAETLKLIPAIEPSGLRGGIIYHDGQFDDARLAVSLARTLQDLGGLPLNYLEVTALEKSGGLTAGVTARDSENGREYRLRARVVINATGVYSDAIRRLDDPAADGIITPSQGIHLVLERSFLGGESAMMVPHTDDGRVLFAVPWYGRVLLGTTDTPVTSISAEPRPLAEEIEFLLLHAGRYLTRHPQRSDILSVFAGLRPLLKSGGHGETASLPRDHAILVSNSGLVTVTGGKWTTYRRMAQDAVDQAQSVAGLAARPSITGQLHIHGWQETIVNGPWGVYGSDIGQLAELAGREPDGNELLHPRLPYRVCQVLWSVRHEYARSVGDVLARRTRALLLDSAASMEMAPRVARLMAAELGRDDVWQQRQVNYFLDLARGYLPDYQTKRSFW
ncbi:MAG: glycerol-3-phosphate dehydrogenase/oxidase [Steroidobacteraceae bacterium]|nr:glycerol-3-phosphate dehydrogenase/oxidase [Deltaproteobacteria bacterium]